MHTNQLKHDAKYIYRVPGQPDRDVIFRHETINCWMFDFTDEPRFTLLHQCQVDSLIFDK
jgi:hypothetical protein